jgi:lipid-binding SYLF domain-containing protein
MLHRIAYTIILVGLAGCATVKGSTVPEKHKYVLDMRDQTLADLYKDRPEVKTLIDNAPGYGTFSNIGTNIILVTTGGGFGVVHNNKTGADTYMRMAEFGVGLGIGVSDFRAVFVFHEDEVLEKFVTSGWEFGGEADAAVKSGDQGGAVETAATANKRMDIYQLTKNGISLSASVSGTKFWKDEDLHPAK